MAVQVPALGVMSCCDPTVPSTGDATSSWRAALAPAHAWCMVGMLEGAGGAGVAGGGLSRRGAYPTPVGDGPCWPGCPGSSCIGRPYVHDPGWTRPGCRRVELGCCCPAAGYCHVELLRSRGAALALPAVALCCCPPGSGVFRWRRPAVLVGATFFSCQTSVTSVGASQPYSD